MNNFADENVTVYVTGSIACYKTLALIRLLKKRGAHVQVVMSHGAQQFIQPLTFQAISGNCVISNHDFGSTSREILHVDLARWTDVAIVMPATANVIAKLANGLADEIVSTCLLATDAPIFLVPAMNNVMFDNPVTQKNLKQLRRYRNYYQLGPTYGNLAEGYSGKGRMLEPERVLNKISQIINYQAPLRNYRLLITAGGTQEPIDPVRFITNGSSGKMGYAIASRARQLGAKVILVSAHAEVPAPKGITLIKVRTTEGMAHAVLDRFPKVNALIMSAALADFEPVHRADQKIKKAHTNHQITLKLKRTPDVLSQVAKIKRPGQLTVGFAAETQNLLVNATRKLRAKKLDLIVANDVANSKIGFGTDNNQVTFIGNHDFKKTTPIEPKSAVADQLLKIVIKLKDDHS